MVFGNKLFYTHAEHYEYVASFGNDRKAIHFSSSLKYFVLSNHRLPEGKRFSADEYKITAIIQDIVN